MKAIRKHVFETNSSSTHSICITSTILLDQKAKKVEFTLGKFGWEEETFTSLSEKASYLYTGIVYANLQDELLPKLKKILDDNKIEYSFEDPNKNECYYVDHGDELEDLLNDLCNNEDLLMKYLFSSESFIKTGNDNQETDISINVNYPYKEYYKGN